MMSKNRLLTLITLILFSMGMLGQSILPVGAARAEEPERDKGFSAILYDNGSGLPTSEANAVVQTSIGFMWIGGYSGLIRYDGIEFKHFDSSSGISNVNCLYVDTQDRLWIGTNDSGLAVRQMAQFRFWGREEGLRSLSVRALSEDGDGNIIAATTDGLAYIDPEGELHSIDDPRIPGKYVRRLTRDAAGVIYGCTADGCVFVLENLEITAFYNSQELGMGDVICVVPEGSAKGMAYLGTSGSDIIRCNLLTGMKYRETKTVAPLKHVNDVLMGRDGKLWVCANNGLGYFEESGAFVELRNYPMNSSITSVTEDGEGNLWFTSSRQGVMKVVRSPFVDITGISGLERVVANTTCVYQGDLYIGTDAGLQLLDDEEHPKENVLTELLRGVRIRSIKADTAGNLWLCAYTGDVGLVCYHGDGTYDLYNESTGLISNKVRTIAELTDGSIAVAMSGGVNVLRDGEVIAAFGAENGLTNTEILCVVQGQGDNLYVGSDGDGLAIIRHDGSITRLGLDDGLKSQVVMQMHYDELRDVYWIITSNSIAYMKDEVITTIENFLYADNFDMQLDDQGGVWILSSNGVYFVNGDKLMEDENLVYSFYDIYSGLPGIATSNSRNYLSPDGILYIASSSGVSSININTARQGKNDARLVVPFVDIDGEEVYVRIGDTITLPASCKRVTIHGYAMTYQHNPQVSYYLEGFDDHVTTVSRHKMEPVTYTNLRSGEYTFHMAIIDILTGEPVREIAVRIVKQPAFYEQWWFWVSVAAVLLLGAALAARTYTKRQMDKLIQREKEQQVFISQMIQAFAKSIDLKDHYTNGHSFRVADYTRKIAEKMGYSEAEVEKIYEIGLMHDIGKVTIPDAVLNKPGKLTDEEYAIMKQHSSHGYDILRSVEIAPDLALGAGFHHERYDGKGYPFGKAADEIPPVAQMIAVADTFDAMHSTRVYRKKLEMADIVAELKRVSGTQLNPVYVNALLALIEEGKIDD